MTGSRANITPKVSSRPSLITPKVSSLQVSMTHHILIAGGGIGGMAAALALLNRGHDVDVYEQAPELKELGAGVQISPNGSRALHGLGVLETLRRASCETEGNEGRLWNTGRTSK